MFVKLEDLNKNDLFKLRVTDVDDDSYVVDVNTVGALSFPTTDNKLLVTVCATEDTIVTTCIEYTDCDDSSGKKVINKTTIIKPMNNEKGNNDE